MPEITAIPVSSKVPEGSVISAKPCHLVSITDKMTTKVSAKKMFIALERPTLEISHIQAKGFFVEFDEDAIVQNWAEIVKSLMVEGKVVEIYFPWTSVNYIRNLVYNPNKTK